jgi:hypothetical protein
MDSWCSDVSTVPFSWCGTSINNRNVCSSNSGFWRWYINIIITILDIIHRSVFYLKLNSTLQACPYLTGNTVRLRYEPNRLMLSTGLWRWYINITATILGIIRLRYEPNWLMLSTDLWRWYINITIAILDIIHRPVFYLKIRCFGDWILSPSSGGTYSIWQMDILSVSGPETRRQRLALSVGPYY